MGTAPSPQTWTPGLVTSIELNEQIRDPLSFLLSRPLAVVHRTVSQSIPDSSTTAITFDTQDEDTDGMFDPAAPTKLTIQTPGLYRLTGQGGWTQNGTGSRQVQLVLNGTDILSRDVRGNSSVGTTGSAWATVDCVVRLDAGDYITLTVLQTSGGSLDTANLSSALRLSAVWEAV